MATSNQNMKRIHKVAIKRMVDVSPDTSWLGEYSNHAESKYSIDRAHAEDCQSVNPRNLEAEKCLQNAVYHLSTAIEHIDYADSVDAATDVLAEKLNELEECDCGGRGDMSRGEYRYFNPSHNYDDDTPENICPKSIDSYKLHNSKQPRRKTWTTAN